MARHFGVYPLLLDRMNDKLIIATADPDNPQMIQELKVAVRRNVRIAPMSRYHSKQRTVAGVQGRALSRENSGAKKNGQRRGILHECTGRKV